MKKNHPIVRNYLLALALVAALAPSQILALGSTPVTVVNLSSSPVPVTGIVGVTGEVAVNGNVNVVNTPAVTIANTPTVQISGTAAVEPALPGKPFFGRLGLNPGELKAMGPSSGILAVTTLTITNFSTATQQIWLFNPILNGPGCGSSVIGGGDPGLNWLVEPGKTAQLQFPTPLVMTALSGSSCIAFEGNSRYVEIYVNGFIK